MSHALLVSSFRRACAAALLLSALFFGLDSTAQGVAAGRVRTRGGELMRLFIDGQPAGPAAAEFRIPNMVAGYHWLEFRFPGRRLAPRVLGFRTQAWFAPDFMSDYELDAFPAGGRMTLTRIGYAPLTGGYQASNNYQQGGGYVDPSQQYNQPQPGYGTPQCAGLFTPAEVDQLISSLRARDFENTRLSMAKDAVSRGTILAQDVKRIMQVFEFENSRVDFAKFAYGRCCDQRNYYVVNDAFEFDASVQELRRFTGGGR